MLQLSMYIDADGVGEHHDGENEPRSGLADEVFGDRARIERRRAHVVEHDGRRSPEGNKREHRRRRDQHAVRGRARGWSRCDV